MKKRVRNLFEIRRFVFAFGSIFFVSKYPASSFGTLNMTGCWFRKSGIQFEFKIKTRGKKKSTASGKKKMFTYSRRRSILNRVRTSILLEIHQRDCNGSVQANMRPAAASTERDKYSSGIRWEPMLQYSCTNCNIEEQELESLQVEYGN